MNLDPIDLRYQQILRECSALFDRADTLLGAVEPLSLEETRAAPKYQRGTDHIVRELAAQCTDLGISTVGHFRVEEVVQGLDRAIAIGRVLDDLDLVTARLRSWRFRNESECWRRAMTLYALLRSLGKLDASVNARIAPAVAYFQKKCRRSPRARARPPEVD